LKVLKRRRVAVVAVLVGSAFVAASIATSDRSASPGSQLANGHRALINRHAQPLAIMVTKLGKGGEAGVAPAQEQYENLAYPADNVDQAQVRAVRANFFAKSKRPKGKPASWVALGPTTPQVPGDVTYTGRATTVSGRTTALAVAPGCTSSACRLVVGAAGGGIWVTDNALAPTYSWRSIGSDIPTTAIGSLLFDPTDVTGQTIYAGTGEPNGSSDSEAGIGLYKSTDGGKSWALVSGSKAVASDRSIASIAVDPADGSHIYIGTAVARHGSSSVNGGRYTPPNAPSVGLYESKDGGATFTLAKKESSDPVNPASPNGGDFFRGGVTNVQIDGATGDVYFSISDYGLYRKRGDVVTRIYTTPADGAAAESSFGRNEFALAPLANGKLRIYLGEAVMADGRSGLLRTDDGRVEAPAWNTLAAGANYCGGQCSYDMPVASPAGRPDEVWVGGQMQYDEIFTAHQPSNGRAVMRSTDGGATFTDMTNDTQSPSLGMHPDQHAIAFASGDPGVAFLASDGGVVRTDGSFANASSSCDTRGLTATQLASCHGWLSSIPNRIYSLNAGLATLQFQSVTANPQDALNDLIGGTQDNGTWAYGGGDSSWFESVGGDGGQSAIDAVNPSTRIHSYYSVAQDVNFNKNDIYGWNWISDPLYASGESASFYIPVAADPVKGGTVFDGLQHVWRTTDSGGSPNFLAKHCNEFYGDFKTSCGDWQALGGPTLTGAGYGTDKSGSYVVAIARGTDSDTLWAGTRRGRLFVSSNANGASPNQVTFTRIDSAAQPTRFISGISVDPANPNHAIVSYSGFNAYAAAAGTATGHIFDVTYNPATGTASWTLIYNDDLGDLPITSVAFDGATGDIYASYDWGVLMLKSGGTIWQPAAGNLPPVAVYGLTIDAKTRVLYAATHGRGIYKLSLS
jgi:hypothetical protein